MALVLCGGLINWVWLAEIGVVLGGVAIAAALAILVDALRTGETGVVSGSVRASRGG